MSELSNKIGHNSSYISHIIRNRKLPSLAVLTKIASALEIEPFELLFYQDLDEIRCFLYERTKSTMTLSFYQRMAAFLHFYREDQVKPRINKGIMDSNHDI